MSLLTKQDVMKAASIFLIDTERSVYFKVVDYTGNPFAPEQTAYKIYFWDIMGQRKKFAYYPKTLGFQMIK